MKTFFNGFLIFGAKKRNGDAILVWMVLTVIYLIQSLFPLIYIIRYRLSYYETETCVYFVFHIVRYPLYILALNVAVNARREIRIAKEKRPQMGLAHNQTTQPLLVPSQTSFRPEGAGGAGGANAPPIVSDYSNMNIPMGLLLQQPQEMVTNV